MEFEVPSVDSPWDQKVPRLVFRGSPGGSRLAFMDQALRGAPRRSVAVDLRAYDWGGRRERIAREVPALGNDSLWGGSLTVAEQLQSRYVLDMDGGGGPSDRLLWVSLSGSVPVVVPSESESWMGALARPFDVVPVRGDASDLAERLAWLRGHDAEARRIARASRALALRALRFEHALHWVYRLLAGLAAVLHSLVAAQLFSSPLVAVPLVSHGVATNVD
ncbi:unnamed protein product [Prorocentrum cordatum]|uniref:Glycosyl transferase CAP10 domain-containing protein n=1 Tax=Prorocentrum cordatum TaxID=2364126 RepID=A0ABN9SQT4_9DINO|nr:unnamed protein product [Polarella glacialis]